MFDEGHLTGAKHTVECAGNCGMPHLQAIAADIKVPDEALDKDQTDDSDLTP